MRVLLAQLAPEPDDVQANAQSVERTLFEYGDAELAVFPELFLSGYNARDPRRVAVQVESAAIERLAAAAAASATAVIVGFAERLADERVANSAICIDADGGVAAVYRKTHLFGADERAAFSAGDEFVLVSLYDEQVAPLICFDIEFPEPARSVARAGADLLVTIAANMEPYGAEQELAVRARALDNRLPHVYVNRTGHEAGLDFVGGSCAVASDGSVVAECGREQQLRVVDLAVTTAAANDDLDYLRRGRGELPVRRIAPARSGAAPGG
jgi:predicted amidohydrolase